MRDFLRWLTALSPVRFLVHALGLAPLMRKAYHHMAASDGIFRVEVAGVPMQFTAKTGKELLSLEGLLVTNRGWSERAILEGYLAFLRPGDVAYDVGANFGIYTVALAKWVGEGGCVIAFEPVPGTFQRLLANVQLNGLHNVTCFQKALGERGDTVNMHVYPDEPWCSSFIEIADKSISRVQSIQPVEVVQGDSFRRQHGLPIPRAIKIDVEGYEHEVIYGLRETLSDVACEFLGCEIHTKRLPTGFTPAQIMDLLKTCGFTKIVVSSRGEEQQLACYKR